MSGISSWIKRVVRLCDRPQPRSHRRVQLRFYYRRRAAGEQDNIAVWELGGCNIQSPCMKSTKTNSVLRVYQVPIYPNAHTLRLPKERRYSMQLQVRDSAAFMTCANNLAEAQETLTHIGTIAGYGFPFS